MADVRAGKTRRITVAVHDGAGFVERAGDDAARVLMSAPDKLELLLSMEGDGEVWFTSKFGDTILRIGR